MRETIVILTNLLNQLVCIISLILRCIRRKAVLVKSECQAKRVQPEVTILVTLRAQLDREVIQDLDIMNHIHGFVIRRNWDDRQRLSVDRVLRVTVREANARPNDSHEKVSGPCLLRQGHSQTVDRTAREAIQARFPKADLTSRKQFLNESIDKILSQS